MINKYTARGKGLRVGKYLERYPVFGPIFGLILVVLIFSGTTGFFTANNVTIILTQTVIVAIAALGMTMIIVSGGIDLSVGSVVASTSVIGALAVQGSYPNAFVILIAIIGGGVFGYLNGTVIAQFKMNPFVVTLGMMGVARGIAKWLARNQTVNFDPDASINRIMNNPTSVGEWSIPMWLPPAGVLVAIFLTLCVHVLMTRTVFGRHVFAIGSNEATAHLCGVRIGMTKLLIYILAGFLYGIAGVMQMARLQLGDPTVAIGLELDVIAAVVIGGASLSGGTGSVVGAVIGALIMAALRNGSDQMGWPNYIQEIIIGSVIILAVGLDKLRQHRWG